MVLRLAVLAVQVAPVDAALDLLARAVAAVDSMLQYDAEPRAASKAG